MKTNEASKCLSAVNMFSAKININLLVQEFDQFSVHGYEIISIPKITVLSSEI